jgi:pyruvate dehydrogenase E2 component (dihydrolipoamide acetyltransferase)
MGTPVLMPKLNYDMTSGTIAEWIKHPGDRVERGEVLFSVEMDKGVIDVESLESGILTEVTRQTGDVVAVGQPVAYLTR